MRRARSAITYWASSSSSPGPVSSASTRRSQARRRTLAEEVLFLFAHGLCHLLGYDHATDEEEATMNARAAALLAEGGRRGAVRAA